MAALKQHAGVTFDHTGIAVVHIDPTPAAAMAQDAGDNAAILAVEPEGYTHALSELPALTLDHLRGFRDAADGVYAAASSKRESESGSAEVAAAFVDTASLTWGLRAAQVAPSNSSVNGIQAPILDTGLALAHLDFVGRPVLSRPFIPGVTAPIRVVVRATARTAPALVAGRRSNGGR